MAASSSPAAEGSAIAAGRAGSGGDSDEARELGEYEARIARYIEALRCEWGLPGICVEVASNGYRASAAVGTQDIGATNSMTRLSRFAMGSHARILNGWAMLELSRRRLVDLDAPIEKYIPELAHSEVGEEVPVRCLMSHTGGHRCASLGHTAVRQHYNWARCLEELRAFPLMFVPGTVYSESPVANALLEEVVRRVYRISAIEFVRAELCSPLNIELGTSKAYRDHPDCNVESHWRPSDAGAIERVPPLNMAAMWMDSPANCTIRLADLVTLYEVLCTERGAAGKAGDATMANASSRLCDQTVRIPVCSGGPNSFILPRSVGIGCAEVVPGWLGNTGPFFGQSVTVRCHVARRVVVAVGINISEPPVCEAIARELAGTLIEEEWKPETGLDSQSPTAWELSGKYLSQSGVPLEIARDGEAIVCRLARASGTEKERVAMRQDSRGRWGVASDPGRLPIGVFRDPASGTPCVMVGMWAYKRVAAT